MGFKIENGVLKKYKEEKGVTEIVIPDTVTSIGIKYQHQGGIKMKSSNFSELQKTLEGIGDTIKGGYL